MGLARLVGLGNEGVYGLGRRRKASFYHNIAMTQTHDDVSSPKELSHHRLPFDDFIVYRMSYVTNAGKSSPIPVHACPFDKERSRVEHIRSRYVQTILNIFF